MFCHKCGKEIDDESVFCRYCGSSQSADSNSVSQNPPVQIISDTDNASSKIVQKTSSDNKKFLYAIIAAIVVVGAIVIVCFSSFKKCDSLADAGDFAGAKKANLVPAVTNLFDKNLQEYIEAGIDFDNGDYLKAQKRFDALGLYKRSLYYYKDCEYQKALQIGLDGNYEESIALLKKLSEQGYKDADETLQNVYAAAYGEGQRLYKEGSYVEARKMFRLVGVDYKDQTKYQFLIRLRLHYMNENDPSALGGYSEEDIKADYYFTQDEKDAFDLLEFEDMKEVITLNSLTFAYYLAGGFNKEGKWKTSDGRDYFNINDGGYRQITFSLPRIIIKTSDPEYYQFNKNIIEFYSSPKDTEFKENITETFRFTVLDKDTIQIYCFKDDSTYTMYRQN